MASPEPHMVVFRALYSQPIYSSIICAAATAVVYTIYIGIWRLYFSPIAKFPGPRLAALTYWYEFYYDFCRRREFLFHVQELHKRYGPIVRINPHELHVSDISFYPTLYARGSNKRNRDPWHSSSLSLDDSVLASPDHDLHRRRRAALNPFFSMTNTRRLLPLVQERVSTLIARLEETKDTGSVVNLLHAYSALANDIIQEFCFGTSVHRVEAPNFDPSYHENVIGAAAITIPFRHFPVMIKILESLPVWLLMKVEAFADLAKIKVVLGAQIDKIRSGSQKDAAIEDNIFNTLIHSDLPDEEKTDRRLVDEAVTVVGAGSHTVAWAMTVGSYHLLSSPTILAKLKAELASVEWAGESDSAIYAKLEKLPYLTGVVKECLRLSHGVSMRIPRIAPQQEMVYKDWVIPAGTSVAMTGALIHLDPENFADPEAFKPERWIEDSNGQLDKCLVAFSGGSRVCLGVNLAWAEMYLIIAGMFGDFGGMGSVGKKEWRVDGKKGVLRLFGTDLRDVAIVGDNFFPLVKEGTMGVRVLITS